ncbi:MAG: tRNA pseudouridine(55) synthase TruB [Eubacteriales bacterium]|nr:tRNA pseudouridine(55) synthase TruB [Eubacteriales bacterium]
MNAIFNMLKPPGMTSHAVVGRVRRITGIKRCGHGGTLDPQAVGVLPVCVGSATRLFDYFADSGKQYLAEIFFGMQTDTQDIWGAPLRQSPDANVTAGQVQALFGRFTGDIAQIPPMYSAIKQNGIKLYELARQGREVERAPRQVNISGIEMLGQTGENRFLLRVDCSRGTYVRTLCHDMGRALGCGAVMSALTRTRSGIFALEDAVELQRLEELAAAGRLAQAAYPIERALAHYPRVDVPEGFEKQVQNGVAVPLPAMQPGLARVYLGGRLLGIGGVDDGAPGMLKMKLLLQGEQMA